MLKEFISYKIKAIVLYYGDVFSIKYVHAYIMH